MSIFDEVLDYSKLNNRKWTSMRHDRGDNSLLSYATAEMDFKSPKPILDALRESVDYGYLGYPFKKDAYNTSIAGWLDRRFGWKVDESWISSNAGVYCSIVCLIRGLTNPGDEVVYQPPVHFIFDQVITSNDRVAVRNPLIEKDGKYTMDFEGLVNSITDKTKLLLLCNPHNPVGRAWTKEELKKLSDICIENEIIIISDEVYNALEYKGFNYVPMASISEEVSKNTVTCFSPSKPFNVTGVKHSVVVSENPEFIRVHEEEYTKIELSFGESRFGHVVIEAAYTHCDEWLDELMGYVEGNYEYLVDTLKEEMPLIKPNRPESTYFTWLDLRELGLSNEELEAFFEKEAKLIVVQGYSFGEEGSGFVRFNIGCPRESLEKGLSQLKSAYDSYKDQNRIPA